jgi:excinuclease ABC subunit C
LNEDFLKSLPSGPGVYLMLDKNEIVLYVGKAGNLRNRVRNYFVRGGDERPRIAYLMRHVHSVKTILTDTEKEALILENNLIKKHRPKYNVELRDDKSFFSLRLNVSHPFPRLTLIRTRKITQDGERYFGPYASASDARITLKVITQLFPLRQCGDRQFASAKRPCLNCQMKRCLCPCAGKVDQREYARMTEAVALLLEGRNLELTKALAANMAKASAELRFEEAARIRDQLNAVNRTLEAQNVSFFHFKDLDVIGLTRREPDQYAAAVLSFRQGNLLAEESFFIRNRALEASEVLESFITQYYGGGAFIPKEILIGEPIENRVPVETWLSELRGGRAVITRGPRGQGARLMRLALKNAFERLRREAEAATHDGALARVAVKLGLAADPILIEGYDISNVAGSEPVGVKIAFRRGKPDKSLYRKYKMEGFADQDDPGMIHQTLSRRLAHRDEDPLPDLLLIDGGKSQLNAALAALKDQLDDDAPPLAAIAKAREEGGLDRIFVPNRKNPLNLGGNDPALMLLMRVRDEAHRFAHRFHTERRAGTVIRSALEDVKGIGPKKRDALLKEFGSLASVLAASDDELTRRGRLSTKDVAAIRAHFAQSPPKNIFEGD